MSTKLLKASIFALIFLLFSVQAWAGGGSLTLINKTDYTIHIGALDFIVSPTVTPYIESTTLTDPPVAPRKNVSTFNSSTSHWDRWMVGVPCETTGLDGNQGACPSKYSEAILHVVKMKDQSKIDREETVRFSLGRDSSTEFSFEFHKFIISVEHLKDKIQFYSESTGGHDWALGYPDVKVTVTQEN